MPFNSDAARNSEGVVIRGVLLGMALAMLLAGVDMAMAQTRAGGEQRVVKNDARLPHSQMRSDIPFATAYVAADGRVQALPVERMDETTGSIGTVTPRLCNVMQDLKPAELRKLDNVVLTPHIASGTVETRKAMSALALANLAAHFAGEPVKTPVPECRS